MTSKSPETTTAGGPRAAAGSTALSAEVLAWLASGQRGISSETMLAHFEGLPPKLLSQMAPRHPSDNPDFARCVGLLDAVPEYRQRLDELHDLGGVWPALLDNWTLFERLLEAQQGGDDAAGKTLYRQMKDIGC